MIRIQKMIYRPLIKPVLDSIILEHVLRSAIDTAQVHGFDEGGAYIQHRLMPRIFQKNSLYSMPRTPTDCINHICIDLHRAQTIT